ncbi:hypothetical protein FRB95_013149 [Tulasnella sp. JGI-2019a]|nr:hypothetical protein FRB95_013149 [Tulasnella sp. JGI-2019a]
MELALDIPEILDEILRLATPSAQAAAAQTCQRWSHHSLRWLWRHMDSYYPLLEILSPLVGSGSWYRKFSSDLSTSDWNRFSRYAAYIFSIHHISIYPFWVGQRSPQRLWETFLLHHPEPASMFSNLTEIKWNVETDEDLLSVMVFLAPSVISLNLMCGRSIGDKCIEILEVLGQRKIYLTKFTFAMLTPNKTVMDRLPAVLAGQTKLTAVALSPYFATQAVVTVLGQLPSLREYTSNLVGKSLEPMVGFDWQEGAFPLLERFTLCSSITHASDLMTKPHQPQLRHFTLVFQEPFHYTMLPAFCSNLSALQSCITTITLVLYSETGATGSLSFDLIRPLLRCAALLYLRLTSHLVLAYDDEDIAIMASSWPNLRVLRLCPDPVPQTGPDAGQPLRTVGTCTQSFSQLMLVWPSRVFPIAASPPSISAHPQLLRGARKLRRFTWLTLWNLGEI